MTPAERHAAFSELVRRKRIRKELVDSLHPAQRKVYDDPAQYRACVASRRGGKTWLDITLITLSLMDSGREIWTMLVCPTGLMGKSLVWNELLEMNKKYQLGWHCREFPSPEITTPAGAKFGIVGAGDATEISKLRGKKYALVICDEAREFSRLLPELVYEICSPAFLGPHKGRMVVSGTPGRVCTERDFWYSICCTDKQGWSAHSWTLHANPWVEDAEKELEKIRNLHGWTPDNAIFKREFLGQWVSDTSERVYTYDENKNSVRTMADVFYVDPTGKKHPYDKNVWIHTLSADFGYAPDPCAWTIAASHPKSRDVFFIHASKKTELLSDEGANETARLVELYKPLTIVGDGGGLGAVYLADYNRRHADRLNVWMKQANKKGKRDHIEILSEELKAGRVFVVLSEAGDLAHEWVNLGWKTQDRLEESPLLPNHASDSALYNFLEHKAMYHKPEAPPLTPEEQAIADRRARAKAVQDRQRKGLLR